VIHRLDDLLDPFGGTGAIARKDQISNWFLMNEITQLRSMAGVLPTIFLAVAAFLSNMVLARLIATERAEIGLVKAFGYSNVTVAWHYSKLVIAIAGLGVALGCLLGWWLGLWTTILYAEMFRFPVIFFEPGPRVFLIAGAVSVAAALLGAIGSARRAAALPPAEAMRPPAPAAYRRAGVVSDIVKRWLEQLTRIVLRQILRWPLRALLTSLGVATSVAVLVMSLQWLDAIEHMVESTFFDQQRQDVSVALVNEQAARVRHEFARLPGVLAVEGQRGVPARLRNGHLSRRDGIIGVPPQPGLEVLKDATGAPLSIPPEGLVMSSSMARRLEVRRGDRVTVEVLEGSRPIVSVEVAAVFETWFGTPVYMRRDALNRALGDSDVVNTLLLRVDTTRLPELFRALKATPAVGQVALRRSAVDNFYETLGQHLYVFIAIYVTFSCILAVGVVYNSMRIALSERGGVALGLGLILVMVSNFETELFRIPATVASSTYGIAMIVTLLASSACGVIVHRRIAHLDLIRVLKTRE
jgi:putative ABC transport system permease protein